MSQPVSAPSVIRADISRILKYAPAELIGRESETNLLNDAWLQAVRGEPKRPHILTFVALGGEGKTSLVAKWAAELAAQDWPGCDAVFAWSFYSPGTREQTAVSSDLFLAEALAFFGDAAMARSAQGSHEKGKRLADLIGQRRSLLILDGLEPLQYAPASPTPGELKDQGLGALLKGLAATSHGLCVVTTRYAVPELRTFAGKTVGEKSLPHLSRKAGVDLLKKLGVKGSELRNLRLTEGDQNSEKLNEFEKLVENVKGHALTLTLLGSYLHEAHGGDIRKRDQVKLEEADDEIEVIQGHPRHAFHVMDAYVEWFETGGKNEAENEKGRRSLALLRLMGLFDRPATADCLKELWKAPAITGLTEPLVRLSDAQRNIALTKLEATRLLTVNRDASGTVVSLDAHPHIREYFARELRTPPELRAPTRRHMPAQGNALGSESKNANSPDGAAQGVDVLPLQGSGVFGAAVPGAMPQAGLARAVGAPDGAGTSEAWRAAHRRLYEHLCASTQEGDQPTLEALQPLYQAVAHGCQAGLHVEARLKVYRGRILRADENYSTFKLGALGSDLGTIACFFDTPWS